MTIWWRGWWPARSACRHSRTRAAWFITWRFTVEKQPAGCVERYNRGWRTWEGTLQRSTVSICNFDHSQLQRQRTPCPSSTLKLFLNIAFRSGNKQNWHTCGIRNMCNSVVIQSGYWDYSSEEASSFNCSACGKRFKFRTSLSHHMKCHTGEATCPQCGKVLSSKANLNRHMPTCSRVKEQRWTQLKSLGWIKMIIQSYW